jgi:hypothetical protein
MASAPSALSNSPSITHLASCPNRNQPTIFSEESNFCRSRVPPAAASTSARFDRRLPYITPLISHDGYETNCSSSIFELSQYQPSITALADHRSASAQKRMASIAPPVGHSTDSPLDTHDHPSVDDAARTYNPAKPYLRTQAGYRPIRNFPEHFNAAFMIHMKQQASLCVDKDRPLWRTESTSTYRAT